MTWFKPISVSHIYIFATSVGYIYGLFSVEASIVCSVSAERSGGHLERHYELHAVRFIVSSINLYRVKEYRIYVRSVSDLYKRFWRRDIDGWRMYKLEK